MTITKNETEVKAQVKIVNHLANVDINQVRGEIYEGLKNFPKYISPKFFYDAIGSKLFETITKLNEYYPTRIEKSILSIVSKELNLNFSELSIVELGCGDPSKIRLLLQQIPDNELTEINYYPVDISRSAIEKTAEKLTKEFPSIKVNGFVADFMHDLNMIPDTTNRLFCFFGSTIGNLDRSAMKEFMKLLGSIMNQEDSLLIGMDMVKDPDVLEKAYNDEQQITAEFNKNILNVVNDLANTNFQPAEFEHLAFYNHFEKRIEMHLKAVKDMEITFGSGSDKINIRKGETIHTENSYKFTKDNITTIGLWAGLSIEKILHDDNQWFSLVHYKK